MEPSARIVPTDGSDYGSDFTPDEEDILNGLLEVQPVPETADNPILNTELHLRDVEGLQEGLLCLRVPATATNKLLRTQLQNTLQAPTTGKFFPHTMRCH